jgi:sugar O-acyltransferase (sialic acid O-acetyltransferase NeuD family)
MSLPVIIIGSGGHAAVIADALLASGARVLGFTDSDPRRCGARVCGLPVLGDDSALAKHSPGEAVLANGIGGTRVAKLRRTVQERLEADGWQFIAVRHPSAVVSRFSKIGSGAQLLAASVVQAGATVAKGCIVNTAAVVEHDVELGEFVHVAPRALLCGAVAVGANSHVGAGAVVRQGVRIGADTLIGAGAVVVGDFAGHGALLGIPAREAVTGT